MDASHPICACPSCSGFQLDINSNRIGSLPSSYGYFGTPDEVEWSAGLNPIGCLDGRSNIHTPELELQSPAWPQITLDHLASGTSSPGLFDPHPPKSTPEPDISPLQLSRPIPDTLEPDPFQPLYSRLSSSHLTSELNALAVPRFYTGSHIPTPVSLHNMHLDKCPNLGSAENVAERQAREDQMENVQQYTGQLFYADIYERITGLEKRVSQLESKLESIGKEEPAKQLRGS
ncbi:hypothetical protein F5Y16DRAFT_391892 [Xylariaceae sp. FL0255]|nr:hypothetical protein F5Y16DRAFT_391892 [Xylariaceae sp. FL0255]